jgi:predicted TIM-barrel fold metal-dependent hydrolase
MNEQHAASEAHAYYQYTKVDRHFFQEHLAEFVPSRIIDTHVHLGLAEHFRPIAPERFIEDWAMSVGYKISVETAYHVYRELLPDRSIRIMGFPFPIKEARLQDLNDYIAARIADNSVDGLMGVDPSWSYARVKEALQRGGFLGLKPYPDLVTKTKGADVSVFSYLTHQHLRAVNERKGIVVLHLPRKERLRDPDNIREIQEIRQKYLEVKLMVAHIGRSFCACFAREGLKHLRDDPGILFDTVAVLNPEVYHIALNEVGAGRLLYGSDLPVLLMRGMREWEEERYLNYTSGDYPWNTRRKSPEEEAGYTLFLYEQIRAFRTGLERAGMGQTEAEAVFWRNADRLLDSVKGAG